MVYNIGSDRKKGENPEKQKRNVKEENKRKKSKKSDWQ